MASSAQLFEQSDGDIRALLNCARSNAQLLVVAHLGGIGPSRAENSIASMRAVSDAAPVVFEVDVRSSRDGVDLLLHEKYLEETTNGNGDVAEKDWGEIKRLLLRTSDGPLSAHHPDSFDELLEWAEGQVFLMLDLKSPSSIESVIRRIEARRMLSAVIFIAYNDGQLSEIRQHAPSALVALGTNNEQQLRSVLNEPASNVVALTGDLRANVDMYDKLASHGHYVLAGTYFDPDPIDEQVASGGTIPELERASSNGIQLLVSNRPEELYRYLADKQLYVSSSCLAPEN